MQYKLIYIGKLIPRKHIIGSIISVIKLSKLHNITLDICGIGIMKIPVKLFSILFKCIIYHGFVDEHKRNKLIQNSNAFIMVSEREAFGLVYIEALKMKKPVICLKNEGISDLIFKYNCGIVAEGFTIEDQIKAIKSIMKMKICNKDLNSLLSEFSEDIVLKTYLNEI